MYRTFAAIMFAIFLIIAGIYHFMEAEGFAAAMIMPFQPFSLEIIYITAVIEFLLAILIIWPRTRRIAGLWSVIYLVCVFPANIYAAIAGIPAPGQEQANEILLWVRLLFQPLLIWWVWWATREK